MSSSVYQFMASLEQSRSRVWMHGPHFFSLLMTFHLTKAENRTKLSAIQHSYHCFDCISLQHLPKNLNFLPKNADFSNIHGALAL